MKLRNASENYIVPPVGRYKFKITASEATNAQSSGAPMIKITGEIREPADYAGAQFFDNMITDEGFKGAGFGKKKLRGLGIPVDSEQEIADAQIATHLLGLEGWVDVDHEQINDKGPSGEYDQPRWNMENGVRVAANKLVPKGYYTHNVQAAPQAPQAQAPVQQLQAPQPQFAQQPAPAFAGGFPANPGGFPVAQAPAFAPQALPQAQAPQGWVPPAGAAAPQAQGFQGFPGAPAGLPANGAPAAAPLPWAQVPQAAPAAEGKRGRK